MPQGTVILGDSISMPSTEKNIQLLSYTSLEIIETGVKTVLKNMT